MFQLCKSIIVSICAFLASFALLAGYPERPHKPKPYPYTRADYVFQSKASFVSKLFKDKEEVSWTREQFQKYLNEQYLVSFIQWHRFFPARYCYSALPWDLEGDDEAFIKESICTLACEGASEHCLQLIVDKGFSVPLTSVQCLGQSPLWWAILRGYLPEASILLQQSADPNSPGPDGKTPLHLAAERDDRHFAELLLYYKAKTDLRDDFDMAPLHTAIAFHAKAAAVPIIASSDVNLYHPFYGTPLHMAVHEDEPVILFILRGFNADESILDPEGRTPLELAEELGCEACIRMLKIELDGDPRDALAEMP